jgi:hypothetical protein
MRVTKRTSSIIVLICGPTGDNTNNFGDKIYKAVHCKTNGGNNNIKMKINEIGL